MEPSQLSWIVNFIWGIADDVLRDLYVRGKYRDVILPMTVLRRLDSLLEPAQKDVLAMKASLDKAGIVHQDGALRQAAGQHFYNTSKFTLRDLKARTSQQQLKADFEAYLNGFSPNVQDILESFEFRNQIPRLSKADALGTLIEKFLSPDINLSPNPVLNGNGSVKHPGLDNHAMGTIFEELVRRFNEENNEEAGEHWTPRDAVRLMAKLIFLPIADQIESGTYLLYDGACGTGGMLTVAEETLKQLAEEHGKQVATHLYGQEINSETYAICKADLLLKGEGDAADNIVGGPEHSTLSNDAFPSREFDFMLSNPPYGKSWKSDLERMGGKGGVKDSRFLIEHGGDSEYSLLTRSSDGQMLFLANLLSKMKTGTKLGSRIAEVHNGSSLFTGDAGQGESNIRRWIIEKDWLEAIVALPLNMFYNTGIATYIWVISNRKPKHRIGRVQLIDATQWYQPLRKNLGKKNCELSDDDIQRVCDTFLAFKETEQSKIFPNLAFGYLKVTVERPLRLQGVDPTRTYTPKEIKALKETAERDETAPAVIRKVHKKGVKADDIGICHAELMTGLSLAPGKVRLIALANVTTTEPAQARRNQNFQSYVQRQSLFRGTKIATVNDLKVRVKEAVGDALISLAQAGVSEASRGRFHSGQALDWSRLDFHSRQEQMRSVLRDEMRRRAGSIDDDEHLIVKLSGREVLLVPNAIPAAISVGPAKEMVGQPFLRDHELANILKGDRGGPVHVIACHRGATETQATRLLGFPDAEVVSTPFGVFVADNIQKVQFAFIANCRDEATTRHGAQRFFEWLAQTGEDALVANRAAARARIACAIAQEVVA